MNWHDIPGWFSDADAAEYGRLLDLLGPGDVAVEVGSFAGRTAVFAADRLGPKGGKLVCVDMWKYGEELPADHTDVFVEAGWPNIWATFAKNVEGRHDVITPIGKHSLDAAALFKSVGAKFALVFIDGDHEYDSVRADIDAWRPLVREGGIICGHDHCDDHPAVVRAVNESFPTPTVGGTVWSSVVGSVQLKTQAAKKRGCGCGPKIAPR